MLPLFARSSHETDEISANRPTIEENFDTMKPTLSASSDGRRIFQEDIEWCDVWLPHLNDHDLPRVLLVGDSITKSYSAEVETLLNGKAYVGRIATSRCVGDPTLLRELDAIFANNRFDLVHFNNGLHGWDYSEDEYQRYFPELIGAIGGHRGQATSIWATTTPVRVVGDLNEFESRTQRVKTRNAIAARLVAAENISVNDLFALGERHAEYYSDDGVHFNPSGVRALARQVADAIDSRL